MGLEEIMLTLFTLVCWPQLLSAASVNGWIGHQKHVIFKHSLKITHQPIVLSVNISPVRESLGNIVVENLR